MELALGALACLMGYKLYEVVSDISAISSAAGTMDSADARNYVDYFGDDTAEPFELPLIDVAQPNDSVSEVTIAKVRRIL